MSTRTLVALLIGVIGSDLATQPQAAPWERGQPQDVSRRVSLGYADLRVSQGVRSREG
jgi:hypothetical protein